jgi:hypothetical protein
MTKLDAATRVLFVDRFLVTQSAPTPEPPSRYDEERDLTVLVDGRPVVEASVFVGTDTFTKNEGERDDADFSLTDQVASGTHTQTAVYAEREDDDAPTASWGGTQLDTRDFPGDVEQD